MNEGPKGDITWNDVQELCRKLGHDPENVVNIRLEAGRLVFVEVMHDLSREDR